jgi:hypothetical protein
MPKVFSERGFEFWIYTADHPPAHSHVIRGHKHGLGRISEVLIYLGDEMTLPSLREVRGMRKADVKRALSIVFARQEELLVVWNQIYGEKKEPLK